MFLKSGQFVSPPTTFVLWCHHSHILHHPNHPRIGLDSNTLRFIGGPSMLRLVCSGECVSGQAL